MSMSVAAYRTELSPVAWDFMKFTRSKETSPFIYLTAASAIFSQFIYLFIYFCDLYLSFNLRGSNLIWDTVLSY